MRSESIIFQGITFRRYPDSSNRSDRMYFTPNGTQRAKGVRRLHEEIWMAGHGPIPRGHHVHHKDLNPLNNAPGNLECLAPKDHGAAHAGDHLAMRRAHIERIRELVPKHYDWARTPEAKAKQRAAYARREPEQRRCDQCGDEYATTHISPTRFCSAACCAADRRASGIDNISKQCPVCGNPFSTNRYRGSETCSRACGACLRSQRRRDVAGVQPVG